MEGNDQIVHLNVGGSIMATKRSTLCQIERSLLTSMFSGRWEESIPRDSNGLFFLDFDPKLFARILDYLRAKKTNQTSVLLPPVALEDVVNFRRLVDYLGVNPEQDIQDIGAIMNTSGKLKFEIHSQGIELINDGTTARHTSETNCHEFVIGKEELNTINETRWRLYLDSVKPNSKLFVGILDTQQRDTAVSESLSQRENYIHVPPIYEYEGTYGWVLGEDLLTCSNGHKLNTYTFGHLGKEGDMVDIHLKTKISDMYTSSEVSMFLQPSGVKQCIPIPNSTTWQCVIGLYHAGDCTSLIS